MADAIDVLEGLGIERAHVVGLSMGGFTTCISCCAIPAGSATRMRAAWRPI